MMLFRCSEVPLYRLFSLLIYLFGTYTVADFIALFHVFFPYMPCHCFYMLFALRTLCKIRTTCTYFPITFVFPVPFSVRRSITQYLIIWTYIAVIVFVVYVFVFSEISLLRLWPFVRHQWLYLIIKKLFCDSRCLVARIHDYHLWR